MFKALPRDAQKARRKKGCMMGEELMLCNVENGMQSIVFFRGTRMAGICEHSKFLEDAKPEVSPLAPARSFGAESVVLAPYGRVLGQKSGCT